jgi:hypothetical protein
MEEAYKHRAELDALYHFWFDIRGNMGGTARTLEEQETKLYGAWPGNSNAREAFMATVRQGRLSIRELQGHLEVEQAAYDLLAVLDSTYSKMSDLHGKWAWDLDHYIPGITAGLTEGPLMYQDRVDERYRVPAAPLMAALDQRYSETAKAYAGIVVEPWPGPRADFNARLPA